MSLYIRDEYSQLKEVVVCSGTHIPEFDNYHSEDPEHLKYHHQRWDKELLLKQQDIFFNYLSKKGVKLHFPRTSPTLEQQMFTRDIGWVIGETFYYAKKRKRQDRNGEVDAVLPIIKKFPHAKIQELTAGFIEGGDVIVDKDIVMIGLGSRSTLEAAQELSQFEEVKTLSLGDHVMHLDTRFTILPNNHALIYPNIFSSEDIHFLRKRYRLIPLTPEEANTLGSNVFIVDPETIIVESSHQMIAEDLKSYGFNVVTIDYSEPIHQGGSFRCTTMPLVRSFNSSYNT